MAKESQGHSDRYSEECLRIVVLHSMSQALRILSQYT